MKIYSFEAITSIEDVRQIPSYVPLGEQSILIPPSFPWIKDKLQDIAISLYNFDWEKLPTLIDALKTKTFEFTSQLTGATENSPATISIIENLLQSLHSFVNRPLNQIKDKELLSFTERLSGLIIYSYFKTLKVNVSLLDPSLFVCIGSNSKIDSEKSAECLRTLIQDQDAIVSILPARICKNGLEETILMPAKLHTLYATHMATLFHAEELTFYTTKQMSSASPDEDVCSQFKDYTITYNEAKSIINAGFNLIPKACLDLAGQHGINLRISNYYNPNKQTITITKTSTMNQIKAVVTRKKCRLFTDPFIRKPHAVSVPDQSDGRLWGLQDSHTPHFLFQCQYLHGRGTEFRDFPPNGKPTVPIRFRQCGKRHFRHPYHRPVRPRKGKHGSQSHRSA